MIKPVQLKTTLTVLTTAELQKIHQVSLAILAETGMAMPLPGDRYDLLADHGCRIDRKAGRIYFPPAVVTEAIEKAPAHYLLGARDPQNCFELDGRHGYLTLDGTGVNILDIETGALRTSTYGDLSDAVRVADSLPQIAFLWPCLSAQDTNPAVQPLYELVAMLKNSAKHVQAMTAVTPAAARGTVEIAAAVAGGAAALRDNPLISNFQCSISPLSYDEHALEAALVFAAAGVPVGFLNMQIGCATAPATLAGNIAMGNAEILAGITFLQLFYPGAPTFYGSCATQMELRTGAVTAGGPEDFLLQAAAAQLARYYRLPSNIGTFATGAKQIGWQAGVENAASGAVSQFCRADMMCGAGLTNGATVFSFEQLLMDCEIFDMLAHVAKGVEVTDETLAVKEIDAVGPQNHFLTTDHTMENLSGVWQPSVIDRCPLDQWREKGSPSTAQLARDIARECLKTHMPLPLQAETEVEEILESYETKYATA